MAQIVTIQQKTLDEIVTRLDRLTAEVKAIKARLFEEEPLYGSSEWWERSDKKALKSIREGKGKVIRSNKELTSFFKNL